eukprot:TRINITY_DN72179_c0_g1_i1.p2 TRINITY_DN72179_c0_g1~~TRINITY_DN72179_c0_g1_i1.p2  ORF type:complete len:101 (+),score=11.31 TRINITY_DN72179_c0_g1_i1:29-304(+)
MSSSAPKFGGTPRCPACDKPVYFAERVQGLGGADWHKACFKCATCKATLVPGKFNDHEGKAYCKSCYDKNFRPKGYGYGINTIDSFSAKKK